MQGRLPVAARRNRILMRPLPGRGRAANDGVAVGRKGTKISRFTARRCRDLLLIFGRVDDVGAFKAACP